MSPKPQIDIIRALAEGLDPVAATEFCRIPQEASAGDIRESDDQS
jgi:hypothetical protein